MLNKYPVTVTGLDTQFILNFGKENIAYLGFDPRLLRFKELNPINLPIAPSRHLLLSVINVTL